MKNVKYEIDPHNRLMATGYGRDGLPKYRVALDGHFRSGKNNSLVYHIKSPRRYLPRDNFPHKVKFKGRYAVTKSHDLLFTLDRSYKQKSKDSLLLKGDIAFVKGNSLGFAVTTRNSSGKRATRVLALDGRWRLDKNNMVLFEAERSKGANDILKFNGSWRVNKNNEIEYIYKKSILKRKTKLERKLSFKGHWDIIDKNRIDYSLSADNNSRFEIKAYLIKTGLPGRRSAHIYKVGASVLGKSYGPKTVKFLGEWKLTPNAGLFFQLGRVDGKVNSISYGAHVILGKRNELIFKLQDRKGKPLGINLTLGRKFLGNSGELLLKLLSSGKERSIQLSYGRLF
jgi:hypothetical protein